jgi:hypothetical protein
MTYASGGTIAATDYNSLATTLNGTWSTAYGQTAVTTALATGNTVTAAQWSTLIGALNNALAHQSGTAAITLPTAGTTVTYLASVANGVNTAVTNVNLFATQGGTTTGSVFSPNFASANTASALSYTINRTITFGTSAAKFFQCGGQLNFVVTSVTNGDASARSSAIVTLVGTNLGGVNTFRRATNGGRIGTGGTLNTNNTAFGYANLTASQQNFIQVTSTTAAYTSDSAVIGASVSGNVVTLTLQFTSAAQQGINDSLNVTVNHRVDVVAPETTYLGNSWGTVTVA